MRVEVIIDVNENWLNIVREYRRVIIPLAVLRKAIEDGLGKRGKICDIKEIKDAVTKSNKKGS